MTASARLPLPLQNGLSAVKMEVEPFEIPADFAAPASHKNAPSHACAMHFRVNGFSSSSVETVPQVTFHAVIRITTRQQSCL
jgi:hypothetical protein